MKNKITKYSIWIIIGLVLWIKTFSTWNVFGASSQSNNDNPSMTNLIRNTACIEYVTQSWLTWSTCDNATSHYTQTSEHRYFLQKWQKTGSMTNYTTWELSVTSGEYIQYKVDFGSITWECRNGTIKDILPSCVRYVSSSIEWVLWNPSFSTGNNYLQYSNFRLNAGMQWYILVTGQIIASTRNCENVTTYINTWAFKCWNPSSDWMYSSVVAKRIWAWWTSWSVVLFEKKWNKNEMHPGETWLIFTITVTNGWPNSISNIYVDDIRPDNNDCIQYSWREWNNLEFLWNYKWHYIKWDWTLWAKKSFSFKIFANIKNDKNCVWSYINTGKLTYDEWWKSHELYDYYPFIVLDDSTLYDVSIEKSVSPTTATHWTDVVYKIKYTNTWKRPLTEYTITDEWPNDQVEFIGSNPEPLINNWNTITWYFDWPLAPWKSGIIIINGKVR